MGIFYSLMRLFEPKEEKPIREHGNIFCDNCKYCGFGYYVWKEVRVDMNVSSYVEDYACKHPKNTMDNTYERNALTSKKLDYPKEYIRYYRTIDELNKFNDCEWFEMKTKKEVKGVE